MQDGVVVVVVIRAAWVRESEVWVRVVVRAVMEMPVGARICVEIAVGFVRFKLAVWVLIWCGLT